MKSRPLPVLVVTFVCLLAASACVAHPGSGIVVDAAGNVYFTYINRGVAKIDPQGKMSYVGHTHGGHWLCLDEKGRFARIQPKYFERITPDGEMPALLYADGGSPIAVLDDGLLYYASNDQQLTPGATQITRQSTNGEISIFPRDGKKITEKVGITGLAAGPGGSDYPDNNPSSLLPSLRGIAVDADGTVFATGVGCHAILKITPGGGVQTILKAERPWSPTGVALHHDDVYVLEYTNANASPSEGWRPRVRMLTRDGRVKTLFTSSAGP